MLLIRNPRGSAAGKITNVRSLCPEDPCLIKGEENCIENPQEPDDRIRNDEMIRIFVKAGYYVQK